MTKQNSELDELREQLEEFALHMKPGTTKGKHRTAIFDTLELAKLVQALINKRVLEGKIDLISWCLSRTSMDELKRRWRELEIELDELTKPNNEGE